MISSASRLIATFASSRGRSPRLQSIIHLPAAARRANQSGNGEVSAAVRSLTTAHTSRAAPAAGCLGPWAANRSFLIPRLPVDAISLKAFTRRAFYLTRSQFRCPSRSQRHQTRECQLTSTARCARLVRIGAFVLEIASVMSPGLQEIPCSSTQLRQRADACQSRGTHTPTFTIRRAQITSAELAMAAATVASAGPSLTL